MTFLKKDQRFTEDVIQIVCCRIASWHPCKTGKFIDQIFKIINLLYDHTGTLIEHCVVSIKAV